MIIGGYVFLRVVGQVQSIENQMKWKALGFVVEA